MAQHSVSCGQAFIQWNAVTYIYISLFICFVIYILKPRNTDRHFFLVHYGFTRKGRFFCSMAYLDFWLCGLVQVLWQPRGPTSDSLPQNDFSQKKLDVPIKYIQKHHVEKKWKENSNHISTYTAPNTVSKGDTHTVGNSPTNPRFPENYGPVSRGIAAGHGRIWENTTYRTKCVQARVDKKNGHIILLSIYIYTDITSHHINSHHIMLRYIVLRYVTLH